MQTQFLQNPQIFLYKSLIRNQNYEFDQNSLTNHNNNKEKILLDFSKDGFNKKNEFKKDNDFRQDDQFNKIKSTNIVENNFDNQNNGGKYQKQLLNFRNSNGTTINSDPLLPLGNKISQSFNSKTLLKQDLIENISDSNPTNKLNSVDYSLLKIQNFTLKSQNNKFKQRIKKLDQQLKDKVQILNKFNQLMKIKYNEIKDLKKQIQNQNIQIQKLQSNHKSSQSKIDQKSSKIKAQLLKKTRQFDQLNQKINNLQFQGFKNQVYQTKISNLYEQLEQQKKKNLINLLEKSQLLTKIKQLDQKIGDLTYQNGKFTVFQNIDKSEVNNAENLFKNTENSPSKSRNKSDHLQAFDEALKVQMKQISELKQVIQNSGQITQKLRDSLVSSRKQQQQLRAEMKILDVKCQSQRKKMIMQYRLQLHEKQNQLNSFNKKHKTLEEKYKNSLTQIKNKDEFFRQHLVGRTNQINIQQYIESILNKYTQKFDDIISLRSQNQTIIKEIQKYKSYQNQINNL